MPNACLVRSFLHLENVNAIVINWQQCRPIPRFSPEAALAEVLPVGDCNERPLHSVTSRRSHEAAKGGIGSFPAS